MGGGGHGGFQVAPRQQAAGVGQPPGDGPQPPRRAAGRGEHHPGQQQDQQDRHAGLEIRQHPAQRRVGVGHGEIILQTAERAVDERHVPVELAVEGPGAPGQRQVQAGAVHVGGQHVLGRGGFVGGDGLVQQHPAAEVRQGVGVKMVGRHLGQELHGPQGCVGPAVGGQDEPQLDHGHQYPEPEHRRGRAGQPGADQIAQQQAAEGAAALHSLFHRYPIPQTVSMGCSPQARSLARMFLTCSVTAEVSAVTSKPKAAS